MNIRFEDSFWAEKHQSFEILYQNMKNGLASTKELAEFIRERANIEELTYKQITKVAKQATSNTNMTCTMIPIWRMMKQTSNDVAAVHMDIAQQLQQLVKQINKYADELQKKCKSLKETESGTSDAVQSLQSFTQTLFKTKDQIVQRTSELQKLRSDNAPPKDVEKCEKKLEKVSDDYKELYLRYLSSRSSFETKMKGSFAAFRRHEWKHLCTIQKFVTQFIDILLCLQLKLEDIQMSAKREAEKFSVEKLVELFMEDNQSITNGPTVLAPAEVEEIAQTICLQQESARPVEANGAADGETKVSKREGFLRSQRGKMKSRLKKKSTITSTTSKEEVGSVELKETEEENATSQLEEPKDPDGYSEQPPVESLWQNTRNDAFYSSSGSDSDDNENERKFHVEIKPLTESTKPGALTNDDELQKCVEKLRTLDNPINRSDSTSDASFKRSQSVSQQLGRSAQQNADWSQSSRSLNISGVINDLTNNGTTRKNSPSIGSPLDASDVRFDRNHVDRNRATPTIAIPRPPSRRSDPKGGAIARTFVSPTKGILMQRFETDDAETKPHVMLSRGPSPLTCVTNDIVPIAVAFHEIIHTSFKGIDVNEAKCQVKIMGDLTVSFPAAAVARLLNNPKHSTLAFKLTNVQRLEKIVPNLDVVTSKVTDNEMLVEFNMSALNQIFIRETSNTPKQYFIVDICKYEVKTKAGADSCPLQLVTYWQNRGQFTNVKMLYKYNSHAMSTPVALKDVKICVSMDGNVKNMLSKPRGLWLDEQRQAHWTMNEVPENWGDGVGKVLGKFENFDGAQSKPTLVNIHFTCDGATLSGLEFHLAASGYHVSLVKRKFISGQYSAEVSICSAEMDLN